MQLFGLNVKLNASLKRKRLQDPLREEQRKLPKTWRRTLTKPFPPFPGSPHQSPIHQQHHNNK